jgi:hypothetical protein
VFVALGTERDMRLRLLSSVASSTLLYFSTLAHKRYDFREKEVLNVRYVCCFRLQRLSETFLIQRRNERINERVIMVCTRVLAIRNKKCNVLQSNDSSYS